MTTTTTEAAATARLDPLREIPVASRTAFEDKDPESVSKLQPLIRAVAAKLVALQFQAYQEPVEDFLEELRTVFLQLARFVEGEYSRQPAFYLGQIHALAELATLVRHQALPREAVQLLGRSDLAGQVLSLVIENRSMSPNELARQLSRESQNLVPINEQLVNAGLLQRDEFGRRVRFSPTALALAAAEQFKLERDKGAPIEGSGSDPHEESESALSESEPLVDSLVSVAAARGADSIEIKPTGQAVVVAVSANNEKSEYHLPKSLQDVLLHQLARKLHSQSKKTTGIGRRKVRKTKKHPFGYTVWTNEARHGKEVLLQFDTKPMLQMAKAKSIRASFEKLQTERSHVEAVQRFVVNEAVNDCKGKKTIAARMLGIKLGSLNQIMHRVGQ